MKVLVKRTKESEAEWLSREELLSWLFPESPPKAKEVKPYPLRVADYFNSINKDIKNAWQKAYPNIVVDQQLAKCQAWLLSNQNKPKQNFNRFVNNWLSRSGDTLNDTNFEERMRKLG